MYTEAELKKLSKKELVGMYTLVQESAEEEGIPIPPSPSSKMTKADLISILVEADSLLLDKYDEVFEDLDLAGAPYEEMDGTFRAAGEFIEDVKDDEPELIIEENFQAVPSEEKGTTTYKMRAHRKFTPEQVRKIRTIRETEGLSYAKIAAQFECSGAFIRNIIVRNSYKDIE